MQNACGYLVKKDIFWNLDLEYRSIRYKFLAWKSLVNIELVPFLEKHAKLLEAELFQTFNLFEL